MFYIVLTLPHRWSLHGVLNVHAPGKVLANCTIGLEKLIRGTATGATTTGHSPVLVPTEIVLEAFIRITGRGSYIEPYVTGLFSLIDNRML